MRCTTSSGNPFSRRSPLTPSKSRFSIVFSMRTYFILKGLGFQKEKTEKYSCTQKCESSWNDDSILRMR